MGTIRKLMVEVINAHELLPKDGQGTSSPYVVIDFHGQRKQTQTSIRSLNPSWNEVLEFKVNAPSEVFGDELEVAVYHDRSLGPTRRSNFLGRIVVNPRHFVRTGEEAVVHYVLERKRWFSWVRGEIGLKIYYVDEVIPPSSSPPTTPPQPAAQEVKVEKKDEGSPPESDTKQNGKVDPQQSPPTQAEPETSPTAEPETSMPSEDLKPDDASRTQTPPTPPAEAAKEIAMPSDNLDSTTGDLPESDPSQLIRSRSDPVEILLPPQLPPPMRSISRRSVSECFTSSESSMMERFPAIENCSFDLVDKMHYLFVRVVKARLIITAGNPIVKIFVSGSHVTTKPAVRKSSYFEWDQTFAFGRDALDSTSFLKVSVWDPPESDVACEDCFGGICFDTTDIPLRDPPDSQLAPQWYRLEDGRAHQGDLMLATWIGTQADEAFPDAWKTDTAGNVTGGSKIYLSPKLWYLRATVIEAQDILQFTAVKELSFQVKAQLGFQVMKTKVTLTPPNASPLWNEDLIFVASERLSDQIVFTLENRQPKGLVPLGVATIPLTAIERRVDDQRVASQWFSLEDLSEDNRVYKGRVHLRLCFDGGYHVMDEPAHVSSDYRPTARQLWKPPMGTVELGIIGSRNLLPVKTVNGKGLTDAYSVAKYGPKWVRTRTVCDSLEPKWNEQYTWKVFDPCTVLTIGVFDSWAVYESIGSKDATRPDFRMGKVRIRISTLEMGRAYRDTYPLLLLTPSGLKRMGEIELAVRFLRTTPTLDVLHLYSQPLLPLMHHIKSLGVAHQEVLRNTAVKIVAAHLSRSEPPLRPEVVMYMLDADSHSFSMRKVRANWHRIINVVAGAIDVVHWIENTQAWRNPTATILVHALLVLLVWFPDLIFPTLAFYVFVIGAWNYRFRRSRRPPMVHLCPKISMADDIDREEIEEEFDSVPSVRSEHEVRSRYDKLRVLGAKLQTLLGDFATQAERLQALVTWQDPRGTGIFVGLCLVVALVLYLVPSKMVAMASGFYFLRHPMFRDRKPSPAANFFRRLPSLSDRVM